MDGWMENSSILRISQARYEPWRKPSYRRVEPRDAAVNLREQHYSGVSRVYLFCHLSMVTMVLVQRDRYK